MTKERYHLMSPNEVWPLTFASEVPRSNCEVNSPHTGDEAVQSQCRRLWYNLKTQAAESGRLTSWDSLP